MKIEIKSRYNGSVLLSGDYESVKDCLTKNRYADLSGAYLSGANLSGAVGYVNSHEVFAEVVRKQEVKLFVSAEWVAIAQISIHLICWDTIKKGFPKVAGTVFKKLADAGYDEWLKYWEEN